MIDTNKYEGHTPAPWRVEEGDMERYGEADTVLSVDGNEVARGVMRQDVQLMADAPLLLAEVKRLREVAYRKDMQVGERDREVKRLRADSALYLACIHSSQFRDKPGSAMSKLNQMRFLQRGEEE